MKQKFLSYLRNNDTNNVYNVKIMIQAIHTEFFYSFLHLLILQMILCLEVVLNYLHIFSKFLQSFAI